MDNSARQLLAVALHKRASLLRRSGDFRGAETDLKQSEQILAPLYRQNRNSLLLLRDLADCYREMGELAAYRSDWQEAKREYERNLEFWQRWTKIGKSTAYDQRQRELAASLVRTATEHLQEPAVQLLGSSPTHK